MITFKKIRFKNFMSYGNVMTELPLDQHHISVVVGKNGQGKCVDKYTSISVKYDNSFEFPIDVNTTVNYKGYQNTTIYEIYKIFQKYPETKSHILVNTRWGFYPIEECSITAHDSEVYEIKTIHERTLRTSPDHLVFEVTTNSWMKVKDLDPMKHVLRGQGRNSTDGVFSVSKLLYTDDLYDIQVKEVHEYYANGLVSHNSSIQSSICYALFGRPFNDAAKSRIVNSINGKNLLVELDMNVNGTEYMIRRGQKPNIFEIYKNGTLIPQESNVYDYQDILEKQILKVNIKTFKQTIVIGAASFTPFMELSANDRRAVIENVLGVEILSSMNQLAKEKESQVNNRLKEVNTTLNNIKIRINSERDQIETIKKMHDQNKERYVHMIQDAEIEIESLEKSIESYNKELDNIKPCQDKYNQVCKARQELSNQLYSINTLINKVNKELKFVQSHATCPTCNQVISDEHKASIKEKVDEVISQHSDEISTIKDKINKCIDAEDKLSKVIDKITKINNEVVACNTKIGYLNKSIRQWNKELNKPQVSLDSITEHKEALINLSESAKDAMESKNDIMNEAQLVSDCLLLLRDSGIKSSIVNQYLPLINQKINQYLQEMDFFLTMEIDNRFNETIRARDRDVFTYQNLSSGERRRLDMAIILTWRYIISMRNDFNTNLLFLDEVQDSGMDSEGVNSVMSILRTMTNTNIFIITHNAEIQDARVDKYYKVHKENQFSVLEES